MKRGKGVTLEWNGKESLLDDQHLIRLAVGKLAE